MTKTNDAPDVVMHPPIAAVIALVAGIGLNWIYPLSFLSRILPVDFQRLVLGGGLLLLCLLLVAWSLRSFRAANTNVLTSQPTTAIVAAGPYRFSRNPIYVAFFVGMLAIAIGLDNGWILIAIVPLFLLIRFGVIAREEVYLEKKFGAAYLGYKTSVRRWL